MLISIGLFTLQVVSDFLIAVLLLRSYGFFVRVNIGAYSPELARFIYALTDWAVLPLRRMLPRTGRLDVSAILPAVAVELIFTSLKSLAWMNQIQLLPLIFEAMLHLIHLVISGLIGILFLSVILSWVQAHSSFRHLLEKLSAPLLNPIRRVLPLIGGLDLSPLLALLLLQVMEKLLASVTIWN